MNHFDQVCIGRWSAQEAETALSEWFQVGAERTRPIDPIVCQNDAMAAGAYRALNTRARNLGQLELFRIPLIGRDGLGGEGQEMVRTGH